MSIDIKLASLAETAKRVRNTLETEEATKTALVLPFLMALDYNVFDPTEVVPEYQADIGVKSHERVDYALLRDGQPIILIEAKQVDVALDNKNHLTQLFRYWNATGAKVGILTNGIHYRFFGDTDQDNIMDSIPFLTVDITRLSQRDVASVSAFSKYNYNLEDTARLSEELFYQDAIRKVMISACTNPQKPFVRWMMTRTYDGLKTATKVDWFTVQIRQALRDFCIANHQPTVELPPPPPPPTPPQSGWVSLAEFRAVRGTKAPMAIRFSDGEERPIKSWVQILAETCEWLIRQGLLSSSTMPLSSNDDRFRNKVVEDWVRSEPNFANGRAFHASFELSNGLFLNTSVDSGMAVNRSKNIPIILGQDPAKIQVKTG